MVLGGIFKKTGEGQEHYWSLVIGKNWTDAAIWRVNGEIAEIVAEGVPTSWQEGDNETLVAAADSSLSSATSNITEEIQEPNKVVFGLMSSWVEEGLIKKEYLGILKKVSGELELSPAGFVVIPEAIVHYIKRRIRNEKIAFNGNCLDCWNYRRSDFYCNFQKTH